MSEVLKQRLVGALILVALGVVFWPIIFVDSTDTGHPPPRVELPPRPEISTEPVAAPSSRTYRTSPPLDSIDALRADQQQVDEETRFEPAETDSGLAGGETRQPAAVAGKAEADGNNTAQAPVTTRERAPVKPKLDASGVPVAWILQVASVSTEASAELIQEKLSKMGHKAYIKKVKWFDKSLYRVYIGPKFEKAALQGIKPEVDQAFAVKSIVTRYIP